MHRRWLSENTSTGHEPRTTWCAIDWDVPLTNPKKNRYVLIAKVWRCHRSCLSLQPAGLGHDHNRRQWSDEYIAFDVLAAIYCLSSLAQDFLVFRKSMFIVSCWWSEGCDRSDRLSPTHLYNNMYTKHWTRHWLVINFVVWREKNCFILFIILQRCDFLTSNLICITS